MCDHKKVPDTAFELEEVVLPSGEPSIELTVLDLEFCPVCHTTECKAANHDSATMPLLR